MSTDLLDCGVFYAVTGEKFFKEVRTSVRSIRTIHPDLPITVGYSWDAEELQSVLSGIEGIDYLDLTDMVAPLGLDMQDAMERSRGVKIHTIKASPYKYTVFLDSDTYVKKTMVPLFDALRDGDTQIVLTNEPVAYYPKEQYSSLGAKDRPNAGGILKLSNPVFFNSGVFAFRDTVKDYGLDDEWISTFIEQSRSPSTSNWSRLCDQKALNVSVKALANIPRKILSNTVWNAQCKILNELYRQGLWDEIHIIHCKMVHHLGPEPEKLMQSEYIKRFELVKDA